MKKLGGKIEMRKNSGAQTFLRNLLLASGSRKIPMSTNNDIAQGIAIQDLTPPDFKRLANSFSERILTPSFLALSYFEPGSDPATT
jgi:hypothetical protein